MDYITQTNAAIDALPMPEGPIRISAAHLVTGLENLDTGEVCAIAMLSVGALKKGQRRFDALGGAIALYEGGVWFVENVLEGRGIHYDEHDETQDARFVVPTSSDARSALKWLADLDWAKHENAFETNPWRELIGELHDSEHEGYTPVLDDVERFNESCSVNYLGVAIQPVPDDGVGTSVNAGNVPSRRLFHEWKLAVFDDIYQLIINAPQMSVLDGQALGSTNGGRQKGQLADGTPLGDNLGLKVFLAY